MPSEYNSVLPLSFNSFVIETTTRCNARCDMCYQAAGPKGSELIGDHELTEEEVETLILESPRIKGLNRRIHLSGGEVFIQLEKHLGYMRLARDAGFFNDIGVTTNGFWAKHKENGYKTAQKCREAGLVNMELSFDYWHQFYISADAISNAIEACAYNDIHSHLRILTTKSHSFEEAISFLRPKALELAGQITSGPVFPTGRAARKIKATDIYFSGSRGACFNMLNLTINAKGNVYPCCAGSDQTDGLSMGNVKKQNIVEIVAQMNRSPLLRTIVFHGVSNLIPILKKGGYEMEGPYANMCHLCFDIFSNKKLTRQIKMYFDQRVEEALQRSIAAFSKKHLEKYNVKKAGEEI